MEKFGVMLDMSRNGVMKIDELKKFARIIKSFGYNTLLLYMEDTYEVDGEPYFGYMRGRYGKNELKEIVSFCEEISLDVVPCIQTLAHLPAIFKWADYPEICDMGSTLLVGDDRTYEFIENMIKENRL